jgi:radical SAM protein with 4Fe4S-binding SPASM domain
MYKLKREFFGSILSDSSSGKLIYLDQPHTQDLYSWHNNQQINDTVAELQRFGIPIEDIEITDNIPPADHLNSPMRVLYDITYACNLRCTHCFTDSGKQHNDELNPDEKIDLVRQIKDLGVNRISIAGGEPLICNDTEMLLHELKCNDIIASITTNGLLLERKRIEALSQYSIRNLTLSIDGATEEVHDAIRGHGAFKKLLQIIELVSTYYKGNWSLKVTLTSSNVHQIVDFIELALQYDCPSIKFNTIRETGRAKINRDLILTPFQYGKTINQIQNLSDSKKYQIRIAPPLNPFMLQDYHFVKELGFGCNAGRESIYIDPTGNVKPCTQFDDSWICGNIREKSLFEIWHNSEVLQKIRKLNGNSSCSKCDLYNKCRGGCRYRALLSKNIDSIDP